jgi:uncharacterized protein (DUF3820 family)
VDRSTDFEMPFGKYKGDMLSDIPVGYLDWLIGQDWCKPELEERIIRHLETRPEWTRDQLEDD